MFQGTGGRRRGPNGNLEVFIVDQVGHKQQQCEEGCLATSPNTGSSSFLGPPDVLPINYGCSQSLLRPCPSGCPSHAVRLLYNLPCSLSPYGEHVIALSKETEPRSCMTLGMFL